jgi:hypothetical protein
MPPAGNHFRGHRERYYAPPKARDIGVLPVHCSGRRASMTKVYSIAILALALIVAISLPGMTTAPPVTPPPTSGPIIVNGSVSSNHPWTGPDGTVVEIFDSNSNKIDQKTTGPDGAFQFILTTPPGTYRITATNGQYYTEIYYGLGYGVFDVGTLSLERERLYN